MYKKRISVRARSVVRKEGAIQIGGMMSVTMGTQAKIFQRDCEAHYSPLPRVAVKMKVLSVVSPTP